MPQLTATLSEREPDLFGQGMFNRLTKLLDADRAARQQAAQVATSVTRSSFKRKRELAPPRPKRPSTGKMIQHLEWRPTLDKALDVGVVEFNKKKADDEVPWWIIQELGTGTRATIRRAAPMIATGGRPRRAAGTPIRIKSQVGRRISGGLVFASGNQWSAPGSATGQNLHWASTVLGVPQWRGRRNGVNLKGQAASIRISKEIEGQRFVQKGARAGFRQYEPTVLAAARQSFRRGKP